MSDSTTPKYHITDAPRLDKTSRALVNGIQRHFLRTLGQHTSSTSPHYRYQALAYTIRDHLMENWKNTKDAYEEKDGKRAYYLSLEFLMGRALGNAVLNLGLCCEAEEALHDLGMSFEEKVESEKDAGLGNGGLGRLAACFVDSCATLQLPVMGYGIRYEYGMFRQRIVNGFQMEEPDHWLINGNVWEIERPEYIQSIQFGGRSEHYTDEDGMPRVRWVNSKDVLAIPFDTPVPGYKNGTVNTLRLWKSSATDEFNLGEFNAGDYAEAVASKNQAEDISMVLYPNDASENGKELRLRQQYFLASASLKDVMRQWTRVHGEDFTHFAEKNVFQLNDTHPTVSVAELMRLLMDQYKHDWDSAWAITSKTLAYTNHTLLPEALERWPVYLFGRLLPHLLEIIYEINARFLAEVAKKWPGDVARMSRMSIIEEGDVQQVRMAYLAIVGSFSVNGVAQLHSDLLKEGLFSDFNEMWPEKFNNKTNGVTQRRWMAWCNKPLSALISSRIGDGWITDLDQLKQLAPLVDDAEFRQQWAACKYQNKERLAELVQQECRVTFSPDAMFDVQVKRIHEYKRQLLNVLHVIHLYERIKRGDTQNWTPRCVLIGGKAAPGYYMAKQIIKLVSNVAAVVNNDPEVGDLLKVVFFPNYRVSAMEVICPAADLSEQISTAGKEASGTGNMKFMMNGALTIGTLDGANIEIREEVGDENFFLFGLTAEEVEAARSSYNPNEIIASDDDFTRVMQMLDSGQFNKKEPGLFASICGSIRSPFDPWLVAADFRSYLDAQVAAAEAFQDKENWTRMSILNTAYSGKFSTDRTMQDYNREIWGLTPIKPNK
ncbi:MAG: glycogen phosphorylase [Zetaproteobacteria bacterium CG_4_9_14_3_um_filter_49_83]|nr:MAG: glycogen phosphorylase [Zetaproteobacteria bacterium CG17_big_fil_post_rev_8_21_14_2_50_50_13]PIY55807.1 MAG: glycogen phosphorylase [Zetaproteobacteria bacterium CG_4_10_14_0_8_um_filter_49_80]PJA36189.1 MAG: glycogen phosphorylase [Zetaproteobacteria bacterium CG_4_9_14_3_um_filter_49_83]